MKKVAILIIFLSFNIYSQDKKSNTVMIKAIETYGSFASMEINLHIVNENGELTSKKLEKHNTKGIPDNMIVIKNEIDNYLSKGYLIISSTAVSFGWNAVFTIEHTYVLEKK